MDVVAVNKIRQSALSEIVGSDGEISPLRALAVGGEQALEDDGPVGPLRSRFDYDGILFELTLEKSDGHWHLRLVGNCGPIPYSIESYELRRGLLAIVNDAEPVSGGALVLQRNQSLQLQGEWTIAPPISPGVLLTGRSTCCAARAACSIVSPPCSLPTRPPR